MSYCDQITPMRAVDEQLVSMTNPSRSAPNAVSCSLPRPPPAHHGLGSGDSVLSPQAGAAPTSPPGYPPADHGNGSVSIAKCNTSTSVTPRLPEAGMRPEEWLTPILKEAEEAFDKARMTVRRYRWALRSLFIFGYVIIGLVVGVIGGTPTPLVPVIFGGISACLGTLLIVTACYLVCEYEVGNLEAASRRARELGPFLWGLQGFILNQSGSIVDQPEAESKAADYRRQFQVIMKRNIPATL